MQSVLSFQSILKLSPLTFFCNLILSSKCLFGWFLCEVNPSLLSLQKKYIKIHFKTNALIFESFLLVSTVFYMLQWRKINRGCVPLQNTTSIPFPSIPYSLVPIIFLYRTEAGTSLVKVKVVVPHYISGGITLDERSKSQKPQKGRNRR